MKKIAALAVLSLAALVLWKTTHNQDKNKENSELLNRSPDQAITDCEVWSSKGGQWEFKVKEFGISKNQKIDSAQIPVEIRTINPLPKDDPSYRPDGDELSLRVPILKAGEMSKANKNKENAMFSSYKWIKYNRRFCIKDIENKRIIGNQYKVKLNERFSKHYMPSIERVKSYNY